VDASYALYALGHPSQLQAPALFVSDLDVVVVLSPVMACEHLAQLLAPFDR
jgi:hypothetical protein